MLTLRVILVHVCLCGTPDSRVLIDAGLPHSVDTIVKTLVADSERVEVPDHGRYAE